MEQANLKESELGFLFAIRGYNGQGNNGAIWWGDEKVFEHNPITIDIDLPYGSWVLAAIPEIGWASYLNQDKTIKVLLAISSLIISILIWLISRSFIKIIKSEQNLKAVVATKDKFFSIIAHDLISPFNIILGYSELLKTQYDDLNENQRKKFIYEIDKSSKITFELLENLLLWAKSQSNKLDIVKKDLKVKKLIDDALKVYIPSAQKKNISIEIRVSEDLIINADEFTISTVIANLFNNAIKFTHKNGKIKISAIQKEGFAEISISDNGIGIPSEILPKLFRIENNVSRLGTEDERGTGLGLIICKEFIEEHNGKIWVESDLASHGKGVGSTFYFTLPI
ncbi:MAG: ATP-binding protein [Bacteroidota bacterium]